MTWELFLKGLSDKVVLVGPFFTEGPLGEEPTIYVDGGTRFRNLGSSARGKSVSVGDGDSSSLSLDKVLPADKDYSDLAFVLHSLPPSIVDVDLRGFLGGRRDHELIGLGEAHHFLSKRSRSTVLRFDKNVVAFSAGLFQLTIQGLFSVVVFADASVTITGACKFLVPRPTILRAVSSHGLSNIGSGVVRFESTQPCFIFLQ